MRDPRAFGSTPLSDMPSRGKFAVLEGSLGELFAE
jgi:hypothetical protein